MSPKPRKDIEMRITQRQIAIGMQVATILGLGILAIALLLTNNTIEDRVSVIVSFVLCILLLGLYIRGWRYTLPAIMILATLLISFTTPLPIFDRKTNIQLLLPAALAMLLGNTRWVIICTIVPMLIAIVRVGIGNLPEIPSYYSVFVVIAIALTLARFSIDTALGDAHTNAQQLDQARQRAEEQAQHLGELNQRMEAQIAQQQRLLDLVTLLEAPISPLADGMLFVPLVGTLDTRRTAMLTERVLREVSQQRARVVILDIAGVSGIDQDVAQSLIAIVQALRLLGCRAIISGISSEVAIVLAGMEDFTHNLETVQSPQEALERYHQ